jgi:hypothetical protein
LSNSINGKRKKYALVSNVLIRGRDEVVEGLKARSEADAREAFIYCDRGVRNEGVNITYD